MSPPERRPLLPAPTVRQLSSFRLNDEGTSVIPDGIALVGEVVVPDSTQTVLSELSAGEELTLDELLRSVEDRFPLILAALEEFAVAEGEVLAARGGFDTKLKADGDFGTQGFYENEQVKVLLEQPTTAWGATFFGGYKLGTGDFPIWEGGLKSNEDGELSAGVRVPLLQGRSIDRRRLALWDSRLKQERAEPRVLAKRLDATRKAALTYWKWTAAGMKLRIAQRVLGLAETRMAGVERSVELGQLPPIAVTENRRLIVERQAILIEAERVLQQAAIGLSLFLRDPDGEPIIAGVDRLPEAMPLPRAPESTLVPGDLSLALMRRPELRSQEIELERLKLQLAGTENDLLPEFDVGVAASQDYGDAVSNPDDKGPFEFDAFVRFQVPLQRRKAKGKQRQIEAKANKLQREIQFQKDQILAQVQDVSLQLTQTWARLGQVQENALLAEELERAERIRLREGESDLLRVNLRERQTAKAESSLVEVIAEHFQALAQYRAFLGLTYDEVVGGNAVGESNP